MRSLFLCPIRTLFLLAAPFALAMLANLATQAHAQQTLRAAAVVNDEVISILDLDMRVRLALLSAGLDNTREQRRRVAPQVMRTLVDETLQLQEAARLGYEVTDPEIQQAVRRVAENNNINREQFLATLRDHNILPGIFHDQIRAGIAWQKIVQGRLRPDVEISEDEVDNVVERIRAAQGERQYRVREIFLSVDQAAESQEVMRTARRLVQELRGGADFAALARQFSQSATAAVGGEVGWVTPDNLPEVVADAVTRMQPGSVSRPLESFNGIHIVKLTDTRVRSVGNPAVDLQQLFLPVSEDANYDAAEDRLNELATGIEGCDDVADVTDETDRARVSKLTDIKLAELPDNVRQGIVELDIGEPSAPLEVAGGLAVLTVCERSGGEIDREQIRQNLVNERLNMLAQRYMRDLRRQAHIDIRL